MDKYICTECGHICDEDHVEKQYETSEAWGRTVTEEWIVCPICGESVVPYMGGDEDDD